MKFIIEKPQSAPKKGFYVAVKVMHGDADSYDTFKIGPFERDTDEAALENLVTLLEALKAKGFRSGTYGQTPGFNGWFGGELTESEADYEESREFWGALETYEEFKVSYDLATEIFEKTGNYAEWPYQVYSDGRAAFDGYTLTYEAGDGTVYDVTVQD